MIRVRSGTIDELTDRFPESLRAVAQFVHCGMRPSLLVATAREDLLGAVVIANADSPLAIVERPETHSPVIMRALFKKLPRILPLTDRTQWMLLLASEEDNEFRQLLLEHGWRAHGSAVRYVKRLTERDDHPHTSPDFELMPLEEIPLHEQLALLERTSQVSLDWPVFEALLSWDERLEGYRQHHEFDPQWWLAITVRSDPVGVTIATPKRNNNSLELNYLGMIPEQRGTGGSDWFLRSLFIRARQLGITSVAVDIDSANHYVKRLYERSGFLVKLRKQLWGLVRIG